MYLYLVKVKVSRSRVKIKRFSLVLVVVVVGVGVETFEGEEGVSNTNYLVLVLGARASLFFAREDRRRAPSRPRQASLSSLGFQHTKN